ncbi:MAG TPA: ribosome-associated translation inhibitor RaiA [Terriglobales bacterium]|nr:ribosome-associated translation inhibitor RaiA [Terriglobales bacterium]
MQVSLTFRHIESTEGVRQYALEKVERLQKFLRKPIEAHVILAVLKRRHIAEIVLTGKNLNLTATAETDDLYAAIDLVVDKIERQLKRRAAKSKSHRAEPTSKVAVIAAVELPPAALLVRQKVALKALSIGQALSRLKQSKSDYLLFESRDTEAVMLLYRRGDGRIALIEPESAS